MNLVLAFAMLLGTLASILICLEVLQRIKKRQTQVLRKKRIAVDGTMPQEFAQNFKQKNVNRNFISALKRRFLESKLPFIVSINERTDKRQRHNSYRAELPRMFEIIALGMRSGLGFDQAFALYVRRFSTPLASVCCERFDVWEKGLLARDQGLKQLSKIVDVPVFSRFVTTTVRALNYGAPLTKLLLELADEARKAYRLEQQELVAKAPVKMLLPTGMLILPAMLLLVIGPVMMDIFERMI